VSVVGSHTQHTLIWLGHIKLHRNIKVCQTEEPTSVAFPNSATEEGK